MGRIPVVAIPVLNRGDLLLRGIRSIDYPVGRLVVVNNSDDRSVASALHQVQADGTFDLHVHKPERNLGVSGSWNWVMQTFPDVDYWLHMGNDIELHAGDLKLIDEGMRRHPEIPLRTAKGYSLFAIRPLCLQTVGWFDENFYPAYCEDGDHRYRMSLLGIGQARIGNVSDETDECQAVHGEAPSWGSHTIHADPGLRSANKVTFSNNLEYYRRKWGGRPKEEQFTTPFDNPLLPVSYWERDAALYEKNREAWDEAVLNYELRANDPS